MKTHYIIPGAILFCLFGSLCAQEKPKIEKKDVFLKRTDHKNQAERIEPNIGVLIEYISLDHVVANRMLSESSTDPGDLQEMRDSLEKMIDAGTAQLVETTWVRARSGDRAMTESVEEHIYPTEYDPAEIPNSLGNVAPVVSGADGSSRIHMTHAMPTAFETRHVGTTFEIEVLLHDDLSGIDLNLAPEIVTFKGNQDFTREGREETAKGIDNMVVPMFYIIKDTTQLEVAPGKYNLLGVHIPHDDKSKRILVLLRADLISF